MWGEVHSDLESHSPAAAQLSFPCYQNSSREAQLAAFGDLLRRGGFVFPNGHFDGTAKSV
jgi:hypothetical protein